MPAATAKRVTILRDRPASGARTGWVSVAVAAVKSVGLSVGMSTPVSALVLAVVFTGEKLRRADETMNG
jgi:hypothetical protein